MRAVKDKKIPPPFQERGLGERSSGLFSVGFGKCVFDSFFDSVDTLLNETGSGFFYSSGLFGHFFVVTVAAGFAQTLFASGFGFLNGGFVQNFRGGVLGGAFFMSRACLAPG